jgi:hypothetical protein
MTVSISSPRPRRSGTTVHRDTVADVGRALDAHGEPELARRLVEAADTWLNALGAAAGPGPAAVPADATSTFGDQLIAASSVLIQDDDPSLGVWALAAGAALHAILKAAREGAVRVRVAIRRRRGTPTGVTIRARPRRDA